MEAQTSMTEITKPKKYLFDLTFDENGNDMSKERDKVSYSQEQLDAACGQAREAGCAAGQKAASEDQQRHMNTLLEQISEQLGQLTDDSVDIWKSQMVQLHQVALVIMRKIMPTYVERYGSNEVEAIIKRVVTEMGREPRLVIRVAESCFESLEKQIEVIKRQQAFAGEVVVLGDPALDVSDCRIEWAKGGVERDLKNLWQSIDSVMEKVLGAVPPLPPEEPSAPLPNETAPEVSEASPTGEQQ